MNYFDYMRIAILESYIFNDNDLLLQETAIPNFNGMELNLTVKMIRWLSGDRKLNAQNINSATFCRGFLQENYNKILGVFSGNALNNIMSRIRNVVNSKEQTLVQVIGAGIRKLMEFKKRNPNAIVENLTSAKLVGVFWLVRECNRSNKPNVEMLNTAIRLNKLSADRLPENMKNEKVF